MYGPVDEDLRCPQCGSAKLHRIPEKLAAKHRFKELVCFGCWGLFPKFECLPTAKPKKATAKR